MPAMCIGACARCAVQSIPDQVPHLDNMSGNTQLSQAYVQRTLPVGLEHIKQHAEPGTGQCDLVEIPYTTLTCTLCQALLRTPRRFQMGAADSGCVLYAPSTALHTSRSGPSKPCGSGTVAFHRVHAHALQENRGF